MPVVGDIGAMNIDEVSVSDYIIVGDDAVALMSDSLFGELRSGNEAPVVVPAQPYDATSSSSSSAVGIAPSPPAVAAAVVHAQRNVGITCYLRGFKFTEMFDGVFDAIGWECHYTSGSCTRKGHRNCVLAARWAVHGGRDNTERFLKWWLVTGQNMELKSKHKRLRLCKEDQLLSLEALETMPFVQY